MKELNLFYLTIDFLMKFGLLIDVGFNDGNDSIRFQCLRYMLICLSNKQVQQTSGFATHGQP